MTLNPDQFNDSYRMSHRPAQDGPPLHDLEAADHFPKGVYDELHHYTHMSGRTVSDRESIGAVRSFRGRPNHKVTVYRAAPPGVTHINPGDWVALSPEYARQHAAGAGNPHGDGADWPVHRAQVPAKHVTNGGNDIVEWGYNGPEAVPVKTQHPPKRGWTLKDYS